MERATFHDCKYKHSNPISSVETLKLFFTMWVSSLSGCFSSHLTAGLADRGRDGMSGGLRSLCSLRPLPLLFEHLSRSKLRPNIQKSAGPSPYTCPGVDKPPDMPSLSPQPPRPLFWRFLMAQKFNTDFCADVLGGF